MKATKTANARKWYVSSGSIKEEVIAKDQFEAWDKFRKRSKFDFGMIAKAATAKRGEPFLVRTSVLMFRWYRDNDAREFVERMKSEGAPDTTRMDLQAAGR